MAERTSLVLVEGQIEQLNSFDALPQDKQIYALRELLKKIVKANFLAGDSNSLVFILNDPDLNNLLIEALNT